jgi:TonB family protein
MIRYISLLLFIGLAWGQNTTIAVFDFENNGLKVHQVKQLTSRLESELVKIGGFKVVERNKIDEILKEQKLQMSGCVEECLIDVGNMLGAKQVVLGDVGKITDNYFTISVKLVDAETGEMVRTADYDAERGLTQLFKYGLKHIAVSLSNESGVNKQPKNLNTLNKIPYRSPDENYNAGITALQKNNLADAEYYFNQAITMDPSYAPAMNGLAKVYINYNDPVKAHEFLIQAVMADEDFRGEFDKLFSQFPDFDWSLVDAPPPPSGPRVVFIPYDDAPVPKSPIRPQYPLVAQEAGIEGVVVVQAFIDERGRVTETLILKGIPNTGLDEAAMLSIRNTRFKPAKQEGRNVGVWISIPVNFRLK